MVIINLQGIYNQSTMVLPIETINVPWYYYHNHFLLGQSAEKSNQLAAEGNHKKLQ